MVEKDPSSCRDGIRGKVEEEDEGNAAQEGAAAATRVHVASPAGSLAHARAKRGRDRA
jgi:hypothetical protein